MLLWNFTNANSFDVFVKTVEKLNTKAEEPEEVGFNFFLIDYKL